MLDTTTNRTRSRKTRRRRLARKRNRDYRRRLASGEIVAPVVIDEHRLGLLLQLHYLRDADAANRNAIADAVATLLDQTDPTPPD